MFASKWANVSHHKLLGKRDQVRLEQQNPWVYLIMQEWTLLLMNLTFVEEECYYLSKVA